MESEHYQKITILIQREFVSWRNWHRRLLHFPLRKYCIESFFQSSVFAYVVHVLQFEERFAAWCLQVAKSVLSLRCDGWRRLSVKMAKKFHYCDLTLNWIETGRNFNQIHSLSNQKGRQEDENFLLPRKLFIRSSQQVFFPASCLSFLVSAKKFCHCHVDFPFTMWWWRLLRTRSQRWKEGKGKVCWCRLLLLKNELVGTAFAARNLLWFKLGLLLLTAILGSRVDDARSSSP